MIVRYNFKSYSGVDAKSIAAAAAIATDVEYRDVVCGVELPATPLVEKVMYSSVAAGVVLPATPSIIK